MKENKVEKNKKLVSFKNFDLINENIQDKAIQNKTTFSDELEKIVLKEILTDNPVTNDLIGDIYNTGLKDTIIKICHELYLNPFLPNDDVLIKYLLKMFNQYKYINKENDEKMIKKLNFSCILLKKKINDYYSNGENIEFDEKIRLEDTNKTMESLFDDINHINLWDIIYVINKNIDFLESWDYIYKILKEIVELSSDNLWEGPEKRLNGIEMIKKLTKEW